MSIKRNPSNDTSSSSGKPTQPTTNDENNNSFKKKLYYFAYQGGRPCNECILLVLFLFFSWLLWYHWILCWVIQAFPIIFLSFISEVDALVNESAKNPLYLQLWLARLSCLTDYTIFFTKVALSQLWERIQTFF